MSVWDKTTPAGSDPIAEGDDRIRELKAALEDALSHEGVFPGASPSSAPIFIPKFLRDVTGNRPTGNDLVTGRIFFNTTTNVIERYNGATWDTIFTLPANAAIDETKLAASVAGNGLTGGAGSPLAVNVDGSTIEINADTVRVKAGGIGNSHIAAGAVDGTSLAASVAGNGLAGGGGSALSVNVDNSTIEINSDTVRVKDGGITYAKLASDVTSKLSPKTIQRSTGTKNMNGLTTGEQTVNVTITSVDTTKSYVILNGASTDATDGKCTFFSCKAQLTSATNVEIKIHFEIAGTSGNYTFTAYFTVVEWN